MASGGVVVTGAVVVLSPGVVVVAGVVMAGVSDEPRFLLGRSTQINVAVTSTIAKDASTAIATSRRSS